MRLKTLAVAAALAVGAACAPQMASAAALPGASHPAVQSQIAAGSLLDEVRHRRWHRPHYRFGRCSQVRRSCAARFGWGTHRQRRCVIRRGC